MLNLITSSIRTPIQVLRSKTEVLNAMVGTAPLPSQMNIRELQDKYGQLLEIAFIRLLSGNKTQRIFFTYDGSDLPIAESDNVSIFYVDATINASMDITSWNPKCADNATIILRKIGGNGSVKFNDGFAPEYNFLDKHGELMSFIYSKEDGKLLIT